MSKRKKANFVLQLIGFLCFIVSTVAGLYMGIYVCLYGGVMDIITGFQADPWIATSIAKGVIKWICAGLVGWGTVFIGWGVGAFFIALGEG